MSDWQRLLDRMLDDLGAPRQLRVVDYDRQSNTLFVTDGTGTTVDVEADVDAVRDLVVQWVKATE